MERHPYRHRPAPVIPGYRGHRHTAKHQRKSAPEVLEPVRRQLGVAHRVLDILVAQISLQSPRIAAVITTFQSESRQGIQRATDCLGLMIRNFNPSRLTFKTTGRSWTRLPALTGS